MKYVYLLYSGSNFSNGYVERVCRLKKDAVKHIKSKGGYKFNKQTSLYLNEEYSSWIRIDKEEIY
jgi:predicted porin